MKIDEIRPSFTVYVVASEMERFAGITESLGLAGYLVASFTELTAAFSEFPSNPPHFLVFDSQEASFDLKKSIQTVHKQLPESHVFIFVPLEYRQRAVEFLEDGVYDLIYIPVVSPAEVLRALDRAAERDYYMYMSERLADTANATGMGAEQSVTQLQQAKSQSELDSQYLRRLFEQKTPDDCLQVFLQDVSAVFDNCQVVHFKWIPNRRVLMAAQGANLSGVEITGLGVNFNETRSAFRSRDLEDPMQIRDFVEMVADIFSSGDFFAKPVKALGEIQGVVAFIVAEPPANVTAWVDNWLAVLSKALSLLEAEKRLHVLAIKDQATEVLNRSNFIVGIQQEVSRSRRTHLPVSLLQVVVDQCDRVTSQLGEDDAQVVLRMAARIFEKYSRVNDMIGRTGADEFGILLPATSKEGAVVKAEHLRRILETADFSKVLKDFPSVTISVGVSEYPSIARDAEELLQTADEAAYQVRKSGNQTCVAKAPDNFVPDFQVREKGAM